MLETRQQLRQIEGEARAGDAQGSLEKMNMTCDRLRRLRPGRGLFITAAASLQDIERSAPVPKYQRLLAEVSAVAKDLERQGLLTLSERKAIVECEATLRDGEKVMHRIPIVEYMAVGR